MTNNTPPEILNRIKEANTIAITLHRMPDGDSLGSSCALASLIETELDKKVIIVSPDEVPEYLQPFLSFHKILVGKTFDDVDADLYIMPDCGSQKKEAVEKEFPENSLLTIDHHESNDGYGHLNYVVPQKSSACSVVFDLIKAWGYTFDTDLAKRLILGMYTDTGGFKFGKSLPEDIRKLAFLLEETNIDYEKDILAFLSVVSLKYKKLTGLVLHNLEIHGTFGLSCISLTDIKEKHLDIGDVRGCIGAIQDISEFDLVCTLSEIDENKIKGSFRCKEGNLARRYAELLGGGGHDKAAAFILEETTLEDAKKKVLKLVQI